MRSGWLTLLLLPACGSVEEDPDADADSDVDSDSDTDSDADPVPPVAHLVFPGQGAGFVSGSRYPLVAAGEDETRIESIQILVDGEPVASGPGVPTLWRSDPTEGVGAGAISQESIEDGGYVEFTIPATHTLKVVGLGGPDEGVTLEDVEVALYFTPFSGNDGTGWVSGCAPQRAYRAGDTFRIELSGAEAVCFQNGEELGRVTTPSAPLYFDTYLPMLGAAVSDARVSTDGGEALPVTWLNPIGVTDSLTETHVWDTTALEDGARTVSVRVSDGVNTTDLDPSQKTVDNTRPTCVLVAPTEDAVVGGTTDLEAVGTDAHMSFIAFWVDGAGPILQQDTDGSLAGTWDTTTVVNGEHLVETRAYDHAGNASEPCTANVTVAN